jgi:hypothetical protein
MSLIDQVPSFLLTAPCCVAASTADCHARVIASMPSWANILAA